MIEMLATAALAHGTYWFGRWHQTRIQRRAWRNGLARMDRVIADLDGLPRRMGQAVKEGP